MKDPALYAISNNDLPSLHMLPGNKDCHFLSQIAQTGTPAIAAYYFPAIQLPQIPLD